jgi:hypothetical protein
MPLQVASFKALVGCMSPQKSVMRMRYPNGSQGSLWRVFQGSRGIRLKDSLQSLQLRVENGLESTLGKAESNQEPLMYLPTPKDVKVKTAKYVSSSVTLLQCPTPKLPEFAVIGRSNVGKSSLINMLTGSKQLALTSKQPGMCCAFMFNSRDCLE